MELMTPRRCLLATRIAILGLVVAVATSVASFWAAGWPTEESPLQPWAAAIGIPAFLLCLVGSLVSSWCPPEKPEADSDREVH
jgi:hypothetical protein